jgi:hypothetical protein
MEAPESDNPEYAPDMPGIPAGYFDRVAGPESGGRLGAINPKSRAMGRYQFLPSTIADLKRSNPDLLVNNDWATDKAQQDAWMRAYTQRSVDALKPVIGDRMPTNGELYAMHFFGQGAGAQVLQNRDKPLGQILPDVVFQYNPNLRRDQTAGDFVDTIDKTWGAQ